jgi:hypothetical protein
VTQREPYEAASRRESTSPATAAGARPGGDRYPTTVTTRFYGPGPGGCGCGVRGQAANLRLATSRGLRCVSSWIRVNVCGSVQLKMSFGARADPEALASPSPVTEADNLPFLWISIKAAVCVTAALHLKRRGRVSVYVLGPARAAALAVTGPSHRWAKLA